MSYLHDSIILFKQYHGIYKSSVELIYKYMRIQDFYSLLNRMNLLNLWKLLHVNQTNMTQTREWEAQEHLHLGFAFISILFTFTDYSIIRGKNVYLNWRILEIEKGLYGSDIESNLTLNTRIVPEICFLFKCSKLWSRFYGRHSKKSYSLVYMLIIQ